MLSSNLGTLYIVATPIGNLSDISSRAIETLKKVDFIAAEDTRHSKPLLHHFSIKTPLIAFHEYSKEKDIEHIMTLLQQSKSIALISDAGTPLISDPGFRLVRRARAENINVIPVPGACAAIAALSVSGLPSDRFIFEGFLPAKHNARVKYLENLQNESRTMIFYESPHRIIAMLEDMTTVFGQERQAVIARELTKMFETISDGSLVELLDEIKKNPEQQQGEFVVIIHGIDKTDEKLINDQDLKMLKILSQELPTKQAVSLVAKITGKKKNQLYKKAI
ncbi:MAG: 16S rRNA (cytidine(1402)-2'-O)-methyltransferase [Gammaproteobacteria bacterium]|nr:16S rRNA (cytidine(1402)-2'-O)-methyltransferase [Gammaproteobacteria bacterium]